MSRSVGQVKGSAASGRRFIISNDNIERVRRPRRTRDDLREQLLESALTEFATKGFDGASTRAIAQRIDAHQPQINYHFASKEALWEAAVDHLFGLLDAAFERVGETDPAVTLDVTDDPIELGRAFAQALRRFVRFAAEHPELNRIMVHEGTEDSPRGRWLIERHVRAWYDSIAAVWEPLRAVGIAAPIDSNHVYWVIVGAASMPFVNAPEVRALIDTDPTERSWVDRHADDIVAMLLPGLPTPKQPPKR